MKISVDVGRSQVKVVSEQSSFSFPTAIASYRSDGDLVVLNNESFREYVKLTVDGVPTEYSIGMAAVHRNPRQQLNMNESTVFHQAAVPLILYSIAKSLCGTRDKQVVLAINLTYENSFFSSKYASKLKGKHSVGLIINNKPVSIDFEITRVFCFYQGYVSVFNYLDTKYQELVSTQTGLCVDIGCYTVDLTLISNLSKSSGSSVNVGTSGVIDRVRALAAAAGLNLSFFEIDQAFRTGKGRLTNVLGEAFDVNECFKKELRKTYLDTLVKEIKNFIGSAPVSYFLLVGGGAALVAELLSEVFKIQFLPVEDSLFANATGMQKFLKISVED